MKHLKYKRYPRMLTNSSSLDKGKFIKSDEIAKYSTPGVTQFVAALGQ